MLSLDNAFSEDELRAFDDRVRRGLAGTNAAADPPGYVAELKIDGVSIALTYERRRAAARRHARRRHDRRGRHVQHPHHPRDSPDPEAAGRLDAARVARGPRRGLLPAQRLREAERHRGPRQGSRSSPTRATPRRARCARWIRRQVATRGLRAFTYQLVAPDAPASHAETLQTLRAWGLPVESHWQQLSDHRRRGGLLRQMGRPRGASSTSRPTAWW